MPKKKTHFEQVPLEVVKKIVEEETQPQKQPEPGSNGEDIQRHSLPRVSK